MTSADDAAVNPSGMSPVRKTRFTELGHAGLEHAAGFIQDEFLPALQGDKGIKVIREMTDNDPVIGGMLHGATMMARQVEWSIEPADEDDDRATPDEYVEFVDGCFQDMALPWEDTLSQILTMIPFGWAYHEICYKRRKGYNEDPEKSSRYTDGKIGWSKLPGRAQETRFKWEIHPDNGKVLGMHQRVMNDPKPRYIPMTKALLFRTTANKGNPEGRSMLRNAYMPWYFKTRIQQIEAIGIERDLAGFPVMWVPHTMLSDDATEEEQAALAMFRDIVRNIKRDEQEGLIMPLVYDEKGNKLFDLTLLTSGGSRSFDTDPIIARYNQQIASVILADFIMLGHEAVGSKALGASKIDLFLAGLEAWLDSIADVFNTYAIPRLLSVNNMDPAKAPRLTHTKIQSVDAGVLGAAIQALATAGMPLFPDEALESHVRESIGLPAKSPDAHPVPLAPSAQEGGEPAAGESDTQGGLTTPGGKPETPGRGSDGATGAAGKKVADQQRGEKPPRRPGSK